MIDLSKVSFDLSPDNKKKATKVLTIGDFLDVSSNPLALELGEAKSKIGTFANSNIAKANQAIKTSADNVYGAISTLDVINKSVQAYRTVKPAVKLAVNVGGIWLNFANVGEIAQDAIQLIFRDVVGKGKEALENYLASFLNIPVALILGDGEESSLILDKFKEYEERIKELLTEYILTLDLDNFLELVRKANDNILKGIPSSSSSYEFSKVFSQSVDDITFNGDTYYVSYNNTIASLDLNTLSYKLYKTTDENVSRIYYFDNSLFYALANGDIYKEDIKLGTTLGVPIKFAKFNNSLIILTTLGIYSCNGSTLQTLHSTDLVDVYSGEEGVYYCSNSKIFYLDDLNSQPIELFEELAGEIVGLTFLEELYYSKKISNTITVHKLFEEPALEKLTTNEAGFLFVKKMGSDIFAYKNKSLYSIVRSNNIIEAEAIATNLPGDPSDIDLINGIFVVASGPSLFTFLSTHTGIRKEKVIKINGEVNKKLITSVKEEDGELYFSILSKLYKIKTSSLGDLQPFDGPIPSIPILTSDKALKQSTPDFGTLDEVVVEVEAELVREFDNTIYKIYDNNILSSGNQLVDFNGNVIHESEGNIYILGEKGNDYYTSTGRGLLLNNEPLKGFTPNEAILSMENIDGEIVIFTETKCYSTGSRDLFSEKITSIFPLTGKCLFQENNKSILVIDGKKISILRNSAIEEIIEMKENVDRVVKANGHSILLTDSGIYLQDKNLIFKDEKYHNGYISSTHCDRGVGIAPFDLKSNVIKNITLNKVEYLNSLKEEFADNFIKLMNKIPEAVVEKAIEEIKERAFLGEENTEVLNYLKENATSMVVEQLSGIMKANFDLALSDTDKFTEKLINRLTPQRANEITDEFYFVAMDFVKEALIDSLHTLNSLNLLSLVFEYYNRHKYEWADSINEELIKSYVSSEEYDYLVSDLIEEEYKNSFDTLFNTTCKEEIEALIDGKSGEVSQEDKDDLKLIISNKAIPSLDDFAEFTNWVDGITNAVEVIYINSQYYKYREVIEKSNMDPIQWQELPSYVDKPTFKKNLEILLDIVKEEMYKGLGKLVLDREEICFSCVEPSILYKDIKRKIELLYSIYRNTYIKEVYNSASIYEKVKTSFYVPNYKNTKKYLKEILENQTELYAEYLDKFITSVVDVEITLDTFIKHLEELGE